MPRRQCAPSPPKAQQNDVEPPLRNDVVALDRGLEDMIWRIVSRFSELASRPLAVPNDVARAFFDGMFQQALLKLLAGGGAGRRGPSGQRRDRARPPGSCLARLSKQCPTWERDSSSCQPASILLRTLQGQADADEC